MKLQLVAQVVFVLWLVRDLAVGWTGSGLPALGGTIGYTIFDLRLWLLATTLGLRVGKWVQNAGAVFQLATFAVVGDVHARPHVTRTRWLHRSHCTRSE